MIGKLYALVIDCPDAPALAGFYRELTGLDGIDADPGWAVLGRGQEVRIAFQQVDPYLPPDWPDPAHPQQMHVDVMVADLDDAQARVLALGARLITDAGDGLRVYADPAGHPFCLFVS